MSEPRIWWYSVDGKEHGPCTATYIKGLARAGGLKPDDLVRKEGLAKWFRAEQIKGLFAPAESSTQAPEPSRVSQFAASSQFPVGSQTGQPAPSSGAAGAAPPKKSQRAPVVTLQRIENFYLAILRWVILLVASVLLAGVVFFGLASFQALTHEPEMKQALPAVSSQTLKTRMLASAPRSAELADPARPARRDDPLQAEYLRAAEAIATFVTRQTNGQQSANKEVIAGIIQRKALKYPSSVRAAFAKSFADSAEKLMADLEIQARFAQDRFSVAIDKMFDEFQASFDAELEAVQAENQERTQAYLARKADGLQSLYLAAGGLAAFLMIVFLSIVLRIERSLRNLERLP